MGSHWAPKVAPKYANLFMANLEFNHVFNYPPQPLYYRRYIDDIFFIWNHSLTELEFFLDHLNSIHPTIKFTKNISETLITYLDLDIYICENQYHSKTHFKTNTFSYLHGRSNHPPATFKEYIKGKTFVSLETQPKNQPTYPPCPLSTIVLNTKGIHLTSQPPHQYHLMTETNTLRDLQKNNSIATFIYKHEGQPYHGLA